MMMSLAADGPIVLDALTRGCSQKQEIFQPAEQQLKQWETTPGFYNILASIFSNFDIDSNIRWMAVLYCKNGVDRYWRRSAPHAMSEQEKEAIKACTLLCFAEPVAQIATQTGVLMGKIARLDCPRNWPNLFPVLLQTIQSRQGLKSDRALLYFYHVTKTLASKRLPADKKLFFSITDEILPYVLELWNENMRGLMNSVTQNDDFMQVFIEKCNFIAKLLRKLLIYGVNDLTEKDVCRQFFQQIIPALKNVLEWRVSMWGRPEMKELFEKLILTVTKILLDVLEHHPKAYVSLIPVSLEFIIQHAFTNAGTGLTFEKFTVNCFNLLKGILFNELYKPAGRTVHFDWPSRATPQTGDCDQYRQEAIVMKQTFFTKETLTELCRRLVYQYLPMTSDEIILWESDPEGYVSDEGGDSYKFSLRPCTETLFLTLFKEFRKVLVPVLLDMIKSVQGICAATDMKQIWEKDAVYMAVGLTTFELFDEVDFDQWFLTNLREELTIKSENYRIIRRRVIWLIGQWVGVKMSVNLRPKLYEAALPLLRHEEDLVVRLEAAKCLMSSIDDFEFDVRGFLPYLEMSFSLLFDLLKEVKECETKLRVLNVMSFIIERVGASIQPFSACLLGYLPLLWIESGEHNMLRCAIIGTMKHLVTGFGSLCTQMYSFLLPVIATSTDINNPEHVYSLEDGLDLWQTVLHNSSSVSNELLQLYVNMPKLLETSTENLNISLTIIESYLYLAPQEFMQCYSTSVSTSLTALVSDIREEGQISVLKVIEVIFKSFNKEGPQLFHKLLPFILKRVLDSETHPTVSAYGFSLFAIIVVHNQQFMWDFLQQMALEYSMDSSQLLSTLLDVWCDKIDAFSQQDIRKISAMALATVLTVNILTVETKFATIINVLVQVLHDLRADDSGDTDHNDVLLIIEDDSVSHDGQETEHDKRYRQFVRNDVIHKVPLKDTVISQLTVCEQHLGHAKFESLMNQVDPDVLHQLNQFWR